MSPTRPTLRSTLLGRVKSLSRWESLPERPEGVCVTLVVFNLPRALVLDRRLKWRLRQIVLR